MHQIFVKYFLLLLIHAFSDAQKSEYLIQARFIPKKMNFKLEIQACK